MTKDKDFNMYLNPKNRKMNKFADLNGAWTEDPEQIEEYIALLKGEEKMEAVRKFISKEFWHLYE